MNVLALLLAWLAVDVALLWLLNAYRTRLEHLDGDEQVIGRVQRRGYVNLHKKEQA